MSINIKRIRSWKSGRSSSKRGEKVSSADLPLDRELTFNPEPNEEWKYRNGHVFVNDEDVNELIDSNPRDIALLSGVSVCLDSYRRFVWGKGGSGNGKFNAAIDSLQGKVIGRLGTIYGGLIGGVEYEYAGDTLWINNVNVKAVITLFRLRPTSQAREYLRGLRDKLFLIIARPQSNPAVNGVREVIRNLISEIEGVLKVYATTNTPLLVADNRSEHERAS